MVGYLFLSNKMDDRSDIFSKEVLKQMAYKAHRAAIVVTPVMMLFNKGVLKACSFVANKVKSKETSLVARLVITHGSIDEKIIIGLLKNRIKKLSS